MKKQIGMFLSVLIIVTCACGVGEDRTNSIATATAKEILAKPARLTATVSSPGAPDLEPTPASSSESAAKELDIFPNLPLQSLDWVNESTGWAIDLKGNILRIARGDETWRTVYQSPADQDLLRVSASYFLDADHAWVVYPDPSGDPQQAHKLLTTNNGGQSWQVGGEIQYWGEPLFIYHFLL